MSEEQKESAKKEQGNVKVQKKVKLSIIEIIKESWGVYKTNFKILAPISILFGVLSLAYMLLMKLPYGIILTVIYTVFFLSVLSFGYYYLFYKASKKEDISIKILFEGFKKYWAIFRTMILGFLILIAFILVVGIISAIIFFISSMLPIPNLVSIFLAGIVVFLTIIIGLAFLLKLSFVVLAIMLSCNKAKEAIKYSWNITKNNLIKIAVIFFTYILVIYLIGSPLFIISYKNALAGVYTASTFSIIYNIFYYALNFILLMPLFTTAYSIIYDKLSTAYDKA